MKRISLLAIAILVIAPSVAEAYYYSASRYRTRYSPYAFSHGHRSGLIAGGLHYSPYAFSHGCPSGLIPDNVRYSPYAFSRGHSGLIVDYWYHTPYAIAGRTGSGPAVVGCSVPERFEIVSRGCSSSTGDMCSIREATSRARKESIEKLREAREEIKAMRKNDGKEIIYRYLKDKNVDFRMNRLLNVENKTLSVDFLLRDKNTIIKYWNPDEMQRVEQQGGYRKNICEGYRETWRNLCEKFAANGGKIYEIRSADREEILTKLDLYSQLHDG